jgi:hypothetical protein
MNRHETIERITSYLPNIADEVLESLLTFLEHVEPMSAWEKQVAQDSLSGKFDEIIRNVLSDPKAGHTNTLTEGFSVRNKR